MSKRLFHGFGIAAALLGFLFFRLWPSHPPLSITQDDYLQGVAAAKPALAPPPVATSVRVPTPAAVPAEPATPRAPATVATPPELRAAMPAPFPEAPLAAPSPTVKPARVAMPTKPDAVARKRPAEIPKPQGVNAWFPRHDVQAGQKSGGVNDLYGPQSNALDDFAKKSGRGG